MSKGPPSGFVWQFPAITDRVIDGDSIECHVFWRPTGTPGAEGYGEDVRIDGINALELSQRFGGEARDYLASLLPAGTRITLVARKREKYGRFLSRVILPDGRDVSTEMLIALASDGVTHFAVPYSP